MTHQVKARLQWLIAVPPGKVGPRGSKFVTPARFDRQGDDWTTNAWSLIVESDVAPDLGGAQEVSVRFLMANAPVDWLAPGRKFTLHEGHLRLAEGEVI